MTKRLININSLLDKKSHFLFGPRQTGKSWLIKNDLKNALLYDLLRQDIFIKLRQKPELLREEVLAQNFKWVVIDEIQKIPELLDEVHYLIENHNIKFLLTGSSARSLKKRGVNLLAGRAWTSHLHPFSYKELNESFDLTKAINRGLLPGIYFSKNPRDDLQAYCETYLVEEIMQESRIRLLGPFTNFLRSAAFYNSSILNYSNISNDSGVSSETVRNYFQILIDTLLAYRVSSYQIPGYDDHVKKDKFYFFDTGVVRTLLDIEKVKPKSADFGMFFESYISHEIKFFCDGNKIKNPKYWRTTNHIEVDFIINDELAVEVKGKDYVGKKDFYGLIHLKKRIKMKKYFVVCLEEKKRVFKDDYEIEIIPYRQFIDYLHNEYRSQIVKAAI